MSTAVFTAFSPQQLTSGAQVSPLVPPGPWFAIWGLIITTTIAWAVTSCRPSVIDDPVRARIDRGLVIAYAGFSVWLAAASQGQSSPVTVPILALMAMALLWTARIMAVSHSAVRGWPTWDRLLGSVTVGVYLGWTSMATWVNLATVLQAAGLLAPSGPAAGWQGAVLAAAAGTAVGIIVLTRGSVSYTATVVYALVGVAVSSAAAGETLLAAGAAVIAVLAVGSAVAVRLRDARQPGARGLRLAS